MFHKKLIKPSLSRLTSDLGVFGLSNMANLFPRDETGEVGGDDSESAGVALESTRGGVFRIR